MDAFGGKIDPFAVVFLSNSVTKKFTSKKFENNPNPNFAFKSEFPVSLRKCVARNLKLVTEIYDNDTVGSDKAGEILIDLLPIFGEPKNLVTRDYNLTDKSNPKEMRGTVKIAVRFLPDDTCERTEDLKQNIRKFSGSLAVNVINGKNCAQKSFLTGAPALYVTYKLSDSSDEKSVQKTKAISNISPEWNHKSTLPVNDLSETDFKFKKIEFLLMRDDTFSADDNLGAVTVPLEDGLRNPGMWFNQYLLLESQDKASQAWLGVQIQWRPNGVNVDVRDPPLPEFKQQVAEKKPVVSGQLHVKLIGAKDIPNADFKPNSSDPYCLAVLNLGEKKSITTKVIEDTKEPVWNHKDSFTLKAVPLESVPTALLNLKVMDYDLGGDDLIGTAELSVASLIQKPGEWFNQFVPLLNEKGFPGAGEVYLQAVFVPESAKYPVEPDNKFALYQKMQTEREAKKKLEEQNQKKVRGVLAVNILEALELPSADIGGKSDPFCQVTLNKGDKKVVKTKTIDNSKDPQWNHKDTFDISLSPEDVLGVSVFVKVYDYDYDSNDLLGSVTIDLDEIFKNPGTWINKYYELIRGAGKKAQGKVYFQAQWRPEGSKFDFNAPPKTTESAKPEPTYPGSIFVNIVAAKDLKDADSVGSSDAFCEVTLSKNANCPKVIKTKTIDDSVNPWWEHSDSFNLNLTLKDLNNINLLFKVYDYDFDSNDLLGKLVLDADELLKSPGGWINQFFNLYGEDGAVLESKLYIQIQWRPANLPNIDKNLPKLNNIEHPAPAKEKQKPAVLVEDGKIVGNFEVNIISASGLPNSTWDTPDVFCKANLTKAGGLKGSSCKDIQTKTIDDNLNPVWNHKEAIKVSLKKEDIKGLKILFSVFDYDFDANDFLGKVELDAENAFANPDKVFGGVHNLVDKAGKPAKGSLKVEYSFKLL